MPDLTDADTIRILVATDSHVGYGERDPERKDDSWKSFDEVLSLAKNRDVDMVLLAGDLFHEHNPSRQSMYQVMRSLRMNCLGDKPCELEMLSDKSEVFEGAFDHVNYEDPDINVAIPVFSIHGNHDEPTGTGHFASLDILQMGGLVNYYGRTKQSDNIDVKPVLLQKGHTKLALYGLSNVRDERLFRTFRDGRVKFYKPGMQQSDWFNICSVHQNHHAYTEKGYLPENFIPDFMDLVIWGHEHECKIDPTLNPETGFHVMQPGSSVATSLVAGEAVPKHVSIVTVKGKEFTTESIRLKTVRPFIYKEIALAEDKVAKKLAKKDDNRAEITTRLTEVVDNLILQAKNEWVELQDDEDEIVEVPLPLVRLRVEYSAPDGGAFDCENPQRFSKRFFGKVANVTDVVQFHRKRTAGSRAVNSTIDLPEDLGGSAEIDIVKVERLVTQFLTAQNLTILPQNNLNYALSQFVDQKDLHAMEVSVADSLKRQVDELLKLGEDGDLEEAIEAGKSKLEDAFARGRKPKSGKRRIKPKPGDWDSDFGNWSDQPMAIDHSAQHSDDSESEENVRAGNATSTRGRGRARGRAGVTSTRKGTSATKKTVPSKATRGRRKVAEEEESEEDAMMLDDDEDEEHDQDKSDTQSQLFVRDSPPPTRSRKAATSKAGGTQTSLTQTKLGATRRGMQVSGRASASRATASRGQSITIDSDDDDDDAFEPV